MPTIKNTFPPLISGTSWDLTGNKQLFGNSIIDSLRIDKTPSDLFFNPQLGLTGYGYDGYLYNEGSLVTQGGGEGQEITYVMASWATEGPGDYRGPLTSFPTSALVLLTDASFSIFDISSNLTTWMIFLRGDSFAFCHNFPEQTASLTPKGLSYSNGVIGVYMVADDGSQIQGGGLLVFDFTLDSVRMDMSIFDINSSPKANDQTGFLGQELSWIQSQTTPLKKQFGGLTRIQSSTYGSFDATGTWNVHGYTPVGSPKPNVNESTFNAVYSGPVSGNTLYFNPALSSSYRVDLFELTPAGLVKQGSSSISDQGQWGSITANGNGRKIAKVIALPGGAVVGTSLDSAWDSNYRIDHYFSSTPTGTPTFSHSTPTLVDGTWDSIETSLYNPPVQTGVWTSNLIRVVDGQIMASTTPMFGLVRSYEDDSLGSQCWVKDQALAILASLHGVGNPALTRLLLQGLISSQNTDGSWNALIDSETGQPTYPGFINYSTTATAAYALLQTLSMGPGLPNGMRAKLESATHLALSFLRSGIYANPGVDPRNGFIKEGLGDISSVGYTSASKDYALVSTNMLAYMCFDLAYQIIPSKLGIPQNYDVQSLSLKNSLLTSWDPNSNSFPTLIRSSGPESQAVMEHQMMSVMFLIKIGNLDSGKNLISTILNFQSSTKGILGYLGRVDPNSSMNVWSTATMMAALTFLRGNNKAGWESTLVASIGMRGSWGGWGFNKMFNNINWETPANSVGSTSWAVMAQSKILREGLFK